MISPPSPEFGESQSSEAWRRALGWTTSMIVRASLGTSDQATPDASIVCWPGDLLVAGGSVDTAHLWLARVTEKRSADTVELTSYPAGSRADRASAAPTGD